MIKSVFKIITICIILSSCEKETGSESNNPYDSWSTSTRGKSIEDLLIDPNTIQGLHKNIFKPTCANSGCHDGNFEPDFRSIESSFNSMINRGITNPDPNRTDLQFRVVPGDAAKSMLLHRINTFIPGSQGQMPLTTDPGSDWPIKKFDYIQNITNWINNGAKDQFGKSASDQDFKPQLAGMIVFANGSSTPLIHSAYNPVEIPAGTNTIKIMVAFTDDKTSVNNFGKTTLNFSLDPYNYSNAEQNMTVESSPYNAKGILGTPVDYWHSLTLQLSAINAVSKDVIWLRANTSDNVNAPVFMPEESTSFNIKKYFTLRLK